MGRYDVRDRLGRLDPQRDATEIYRTLASVEFPWDINQALSFALFRTYAVPTIGALLARTGEFTGRVQKRYDDTALILDAILQGGTSSPEGKVALRRMNRMHAAYAISNADLLYVLCTFVVVPVRWLDAYGWRRLTDTERVANVAHYRDVGRHMGITDLPTTYAGFATYLDDYERSHFAYDQGGRAVADATLDLMTTFPPNHRLPKRVSRRFARAVMDEPLRAALHIAAPTRVEQWLARRLLRLRGRYVRLLPPRSVPLQARDLPNIRSYPNGYDVADLGTFPGADGKRVRA